MRLMPRSSSTPGKEELLFHKMWSVLELIPPSRQSPLVYFSERTKLTKVELCEGVVEIGDSSFRWCDHSITKIDIPDSLRRIKDFAFVSSLRTPIRLHNGIESIGVEAFAWCIFTNFRVPSLITAILITCYPPVH
jgi:hypothetical protein